MASRDDWMKMTKGGSRTSAYTAETPEEKKKKKKGRRNTRKEQMANQEVGVASLAIRDRK